MRLAYVTETFPPEINGVALTAARTVAWLRERGHAVQLIRPRQRAERPRDDASEWRTTGWPIPMYADLQFGWAGPSALAARWRAVPPRLVHLATPGPLAWSAAHAARRLGVPVSADFRTNFHQYSRHYRLGWLAPLVLAGLRRFHNGAQCTFVPTSALQQELQRAGFEHLCVVGRGVDVAFFHPRWRCPAQRAAWGAAPGDLVLLYVGRLAAEKNVALALEAFEAVRREQPGVVMVVVGDGPQRRALQAAHPAARFVGLQSGRALARSYASADVFLFPSLTDTFGNVTLEALASGLALVAYDTAAAAQHAVHGTSALLAAPGDAQAYVDAVRQCARQHRQQPQALQALRAQGLAAAGRASWETVLLRFERHLQRLTDAYPTTARPVSLVA